MTAQRKAAAERAPVGGLVTLEVTIGANDARRLMRQPAFGGLTAEACAASIVAEVLADDAAAHGEGARP